ncbi:hypothetical protein V5F38_04075 [Xanthobacter sp. V0B-10]|uniref:hypothetical protein n=1 Tax=Xanthobacter albus TaxID=3119929 RepID=UPI0037271BFF
MLFSIDEDAGTHVVGWIMPDNPASTPHVAVFANGELRKVVPATMLRPLLREQGLHETGICGFVVDEQVVPRLAEVKDLEIYDDATNVRIYRRRPESAKAEGKFFRLETRLVTQSALNEAFQNLFHMAFTRLERVPEEAVRSILGIAFASSIFACGRLHFRAYEPLLRDRGFRCSVLLRDPFEELAEQLLVLRWAAKTPKLAYSVLSEAYRPLVESFGRADVQEVSDLETWVGTLGAHERALLSSPMARLLTCASSDDQLASSAVENALDTLSEMDVVGLSGDFDAYWGTLSAVLELPLPEPPPLSASSLARRLEEQVREWPVAQELLAADIQIFADVNAAFGRADEVVDEASTDAS